MLRAHDVVVAGGTFRVLLTPLQRVVVVLDVETSPLGPLHMAFNIDRAPELPSHIHPAYLSAPGDYGPEVAQAVRNASMRTFNTASLAARHIASPTIGLTRQAASEAAALTLRSRLPSQAHHHAAHLLLRFRLGDLKAKAIVERIVRDARAGVAGARRAAETLTHASKAIAKVVDVPVGLAAHLGIGGSIGSALAQLHETLGAVKRGDFHAVQQLVQSHLGELQAAVSKVPGIGSGVAAGLSAGLAALSGDHPIEIAIKVAYGAIPIPPEVRRETDIALSAVLAFVEHPHSLTDASLQFARERLPTGTPRDVFDTLVHILVKHVPIQREAIELASHYAQKYAPTLALPGMGDAAKALGLDPGLVQRVVANIVNPSERASSH